MRIAIPSDDQSTIASHFGRAAGFLVYDVNGDQISPLEYRSLAGGHACDCGTEGHGRHAAAHGDSHHGRIGGLLADCGLVIAIGMGRGMLDALVDGGIEVMFTSVTDPLEAIRLAADESVPAGTSGCCCSH